MSFTYGLKAFTEKVESDKYFNGFLKNTIKKIVTWSMACMEKLNVMNSQIGLRPANAAPTAIPAKPISVIGVSITRLSPYFFHSPLEITLRNILKCWNQLFK